jgi:tRNA nucleotidyltransferase/poly(A) polymerase
MTKIPANIKEVLKKLEASGFEAFVVGGCVRDLLLDVEPQDWDITTNAKPEEVQKIFPDSVYENQFGTVGVKLKVENEKSKIIIDNSKVKKEPLIANHQLKAGKYEIVEVTTYRVESKYTDKRHPDKIKFAKTLEEDLSRRDFTINAMALKISNPKTQTPDELPDSNNNQEVKFKDQNIIDPFNGKKDLENKIIRAVGDANERFNEDALRMIRAVRFISALGGNPKYQKKEPKRVLENNKKQWQVEKETLRAIEKNADNLRYIAKERIQDELTKIIISDQPAKGVDLLVQTRLMKHIMPEIGHTIGVKQNRHHYYGPYNTVYAHMLASLEKCPSKKLEVRLASFLHDVGKPMTKQGEGELATFH